MDKLDESIEYFVRRVNKELGKSDKDDFTINWFKALKGIARFIEGENKAWYIVYIVAPTMWGNKELSVVSFYAEPGVGRVGRLLKIMRLIHRTAKAEGCRRIVMGSHAGNREKLNRFLRASGFKEQSFVKET